jgi:hypothetical protein
LRILSCHPVRKNPSHKTFTPKSYTITLKNGCFDEEKIKNYLNRTEFIYSRFNRKGKSKTIDLKAMVFSLSLSAPNTLEMILKTKSGNTIRPYEVLEKIFGLAEEEIRQARIVKR